MPCCAVCKLKNKEIRYCEAFHYISRVCEGSVEKLGEHIININCHIMFE